MQLLSILKKEWLLLLKDKIGLLILFILPVCLLILVTLAQQNFYGEKPTLKVLVLNQDKGKIGKEITKVLKKQTEFKVTEYHQTRDNTKAKAEQEVAKGEYNAFIIINKNLSQDVRKNLRQLMRNRTKTRINSIQLYTDPAMPNNMVKNLEISLDYLLQSVQLQATQNLLLKTQRIKGRPATKKWFELKQKYASISKARPTTHPNSVQQNVPAWTLFGMFFIVIPLAGQMVRERSQGVIQRIRIAPVAQTTHLLGRVVCYVILNLLQMSLMLIVGVFLLPVMGLPSLNVGNHLGLIYLVGFFSSLGAIGFGLLIGSYASSYQQATIFAPFIIVIAASVSGIFIPVYLMPTALTYISEISPLYWAQSAFLDIFVLNVGFVELLPNLAKLFGFFILMLIISLIPTNKRFSQKAIQ